MPNQNQSGPNILLIMTDQHRVGFTGRTGCPVDAMPRLDALADQGTAFDVAYTSYPACVPARTSLLTGRFPTAHRVRQNSNAGAAYYQQDLLDVLRGQGYQLHFAGKPHMHPGPEDFDSYAGPYMHASGPRRTADHRRFDEWLHDLDHGVAAEPTPFGLQEQLPYRITSDAIAAVDTAAVDRPAFWWVSFPEPHNPYQVPEPYFSLVAEDEVPERIAGPEAIEGKGRSYRWLRNLVEDKRPGYDQEWRRYRANYLGMLRLIDDQIARLLDHLGDRLDNTVVIFISDHGDYVGDYGLQRKGAGMSDALMRIPFQFTGPGIARQQRHEPVSMVDLLPTICELVGAEIPAGVQGRSLMPLLAGEPAPAEEFASIIGELGYGGVPYGEDERPELHFSYQGRTFDELNSVTQSGGTRMIRRGDHKLIMDVDGTVELYDLSVDPGELIDLSDRTDHRDVRDDLTTELARWMIRIADDLPTGAYRPKTAPHNWRWA
jgi:arylsulfatase A-like enzyme